MCKMMEDRVKETAMDTAVEIASNLIKGGIGQIEDIAKATGLSIEKVNSLAAEIKTKPQ